MFNAIRKLTPNWLREAYFKARTGNYGHVSGDGFPVLLKKINRYFDKHPAERKQYEQEIDFLNNKSSDFSSTEILPYSFSEKYNYRDVQVSKDESCGLFYVMLDGKRLYYHRGFKKAEDVQKDFTYSAIEQDVNSPHHYLDENFHIGADDIVADLGAAEGNFSLFVVDKVKAVYIFEAMDIWQEALQKTFEPWKEKVHIVSKYVGDTDGPTTVKLSSFFKDIPLTVVKMDIEGAEVSVLRSSIEFLKERPLSLNITTYHRHDDATVIKTILEDVGYKTWFSKGYMLFIYDSLMPPYFRKGLIKAKK